MDYLTRQKEDLQERQIQLLNNIKDFAAYHTHQFALCMFFLEMQSPQHALCGAGLVVLSQR